MNWVMSDDVYVSMFVVFTSSVGPESAVFVAVLSIWPIIIEATKTKGAKSSTPALFPWAEPWKN